MAENVIHFKAEFTNEMLEQIRAVVREELQEAKKQAVWTPEDEDTFLRGVLRSRLSLGIMSLPEYRAELARLDKQKIQASDTSTVEPPKYQYLAGNPISGIHQLDLGAFQMKEVDTSTDANLVSGTVVKDGKLTDFGRSLTAELEHQGKLYKGVLSFVKDIE